MVSKFNPLLTQNPSPHESPNRWPKPLPNGLLSSAYSECPNLIHPLQITNTFLHHSFIHSNRDLQFYNEAPITPSQWLDDWQPHTDAGGTDGTCRPGWLREGPMSPREICHRTAFYSISDTHNSHTRFSRNIIPCHFTWRTSLTYNHSQPTYFRMIDELWTHILANEINDMTLTN